MKGKSRAFSKTFEALCVAVRVYKNDRHVGCATDSIIFNTPIFLLDAQCGGMGMKEYERVVMLKDTEGSFQRYGQNLLIL